MTYIKDDNTCKCKVIESQSSLKNGTPIKGERGVSNPHLGRDVSCPDVKSVDHTTTPSMKEDSLSTFGHDIIHYINGDFRKFSLSVCGLKYGDEFNQFTVHKYLLSYPPLQSIELSQGIAYYFLLDILFA